MKAINIILTICLIVVLGACDMGGGDTGGGSGGGNVCNEAKVCQQVTEENKSEVTEWAGRSCKVGDWVGQGDSKCSSTEAKCKCK